MGGDILKSNSRVIKIGSYLHIIRVCVCVCVCWGRSCFLSSGARLSAQHRGLRVAGQGCPHKGVRSEDPRVPDQVPNVEQPEATMCSRRARKTGLCCPEEDDDLGNASVVMLRVGGGMSLGQARPRLLVGTQSVCTIVSAATLCGT